MQVDKPVRIPEILIERDKETNRVINVKRIGTSTYTAKNNAEAYLLKIDMAKKIARLKK